MSLSVCGDQVLINPHAYLEAAEGASPAETLELQRRAAEQLLRSGHVDEGLSVLRKVLDRIGMRLPSTPRGALLSFLLRRLQLRLRGLSFRERPATEIPPEDLTRIDVCWSVSIGLSLIDTIRGRDFQARHMLLALESGEPYRVARAMANEAGYTATAGWPARRRTSQLVNRAMILADRVEEPHARGMANLNAGIAAYLEGRWQVGWELAQRSEDIFREQCTGVAGELNLTHVFSLRALVFLGGLRELSERLPKLLKEAAERGDLFAATSLGTRFSYLVNLSRDDADRARAQLRQAADEWSQQDFTMQHYFQMVGDAEISLYSGANHSAWKSLLGRWRDLERSLLRRIQLFRVESQHLRARCALAAATRGSLAAADRKRLLRATGRDARRIEREDVAWSNPLAALLRAGIASVEGNREEALEKLSEAESGFESSQMALYAAAAKRCRGLLLGRRGGARPGRGRRIAGCETS